MSTTERLSDHVAWSSTPVPIWRRAIRWIPAILGLGIELLGQGGGSIEGSPVFDPKLEAGGEGVLGTVSVAGTGGGMPAKYPATQVLSIYQDRACIQPGPVEVELPLRGLAVVGARRVGLRWTRRKAADAVWMVQVRGDGMDLTFRGRWLMLAQLGTLGQWPEPA